MYLCGKGGGRDYRIEAGWRDDIGYMLNPWASRSISLSWVPFAIDNGCYSKTFVFNLSGWVTDLIRIAKHYASTCLFVVAPDVVGNALATLGRSLVVLPLIRRIGLRAAYVTQDGQQSVAVPWDSFDVLFVGGTNAWKDSDASWALCAEAKRLGKSVHVGRVNGLRRLHECKRRDVDSVDGTMVRYAPLLMWDKLCALLDSPVEVLS